MHSCRQEWTIEKNLCIFRPRLLMRGGPPLMVGMSFKHNSYDCWKSLHSGTTAHLIIMTMYPSLRFNGGKNMGVKMVKGRKRKCSKGVRSRSGNRHAPSGICRRLRPGYGSGKCNRGRAILIRRQYATAAACWPLRPEYEAGNAGKLCDSSQGTRCWGVPSAGSCGQSMIAIGTLWQNVMSVRRQGIRMNGGKGR